MGFADPRDGDIEDDASSTSRHSLLSHAGTMLLDTSLPKLALALVQALVIPGLVLGAAPIVSLWFLQQVWWRLPAEANLAWLSLFLAVDAWLVWRFGPRLFRLVERNFWSLNAALVQPLFMAVREAVRQGMEARLARGVPDPAVLARRRSWSGLLAGGLIAVLAALLALAVGPLPRWFAPLLSLDDLPGFLGDALANGVWAVSAYLAVAAPAWSLGEALAGAPRDLPPRRAARRRIGGSRTCRTSTWSGRNTASAWNAAATARAATAASRRRCRPWKRPMRGPGSTWCWSPATSPMPGATRSGSPSPRRSPRIRRSRRGCWCCRETTT